MAYRKLWRVTQNSYPGFQDWNALTGNASAHLAQLATGHRTVETSGLDQLAGRRLGDHALHEVPRAVAILRPVGGATPHLHSQFLEAPIVGVEYRGVGEYLIRTRGLPQNARAHASVSAGGGGLRAMRAHVERYWTDIFIAQGGPLNPGETGQGFRVRLSEWTGSAWDPADAEVSLVVYAQAF